MHTTRAGNWAPALQATLEQARAAEDDYAQICVGWVDNARRDGFLTWPSPQPGDPFTAELVFDAADQEQARAFSEGCDDAAFFRTPEQQQAANSPGGNDAGVAEFKQREEQAAAERGMTVDEFWQWVADSTRNMTPAEEEQFHGGSRLLSRGYANEPFD